MLNVTFMDDLLIALHRGPFETPPWDGFLHRLRDICEANYAGILFRPMDRPPNSPLELFAGPAALPDIPRMYEEGFYRLDPYLNGNLEEGEVYGLDRLIDKGNPDHRRYVDELLIPRGLRHMLGVRVREPSGIGAWLYLGRDELPFPPDHSVILKQVAAHFRISLQTYVTMENQRVHAAISDTAISRLNFGWISLDATGTIVEASHQARHMLRRNGPLTASPSGRLTASGRDLNMRLSTAVSDIAQRGATQPRALSISNDPWLSLLLVPIANPIASTGRTAVMTAFLQDDENSMVDRHEQIAELFGLLPSEARLAVAICRGASIAEAAAQMGISEATARNYSKRIYAKMGARGQADVVRFVLTSVLALAMSQ